MTAPVRLRLFRTKGFDLQALSRATNGLEAVKVTRPSAFSNPFTVRQATEVFDCRTESAHRHAVDWFRQWLDAEDESFEPMCAYDGLKDQRDTLLRRLPELRGKNLACFCGPHLACHVDELLKRANRPICEEVA